MGPSAVSDVLLSEENGEKIVARAIGRGWKTPPGGKFKVLATVRENCTAAFPPRGRLQV